MIKKLKIYILCGFFDWREHAKNGLLFKLEDMGGHCIGNYRTINMMSVNAAWEYEFKLKP